MALFKTEEKILPDHLRYTEMVKCKSSGMLPAYAYLLEIIGGLYLFTLSDNGIFAGIVVIGHALYRLANTGRMQAACQFCQETQHKLLKNGKSFKCKSCGHQLGIYGTKLADLNSSSSEVPATATKDDIPAHVVVANRKEKSKQTNHAIGTAVFVGLIIWFYAGGGWEKLTDHEMGKITDKVANDMVDQYDIAKRNGNRVDVCVHAGLVKAGYLQAKDEANFQKWNAIEASDCAYLGKR